MAMSEFCRVDVLLKLVVKWIIMANSLARSLRRPTHSYLTGSHNTKKKKKKKNEGRRISSTCLFCNQSKKRETLGALYTSILSCDVQVRDKRKQRLIVYHSLTTNRFQSYLTLHCLPSLASQFFLFYHVYLSEPRFPIRISTYLLITRLIIYLFIYLFIELVGLHWE